MEIKKASVDGQAAMGQLWERATAVPAGTPITLGISKVLTADELMELLRSDSKTPRQGGPASSSASKPTMAGHGVVAVSLSAEDLSDPNGARIQSLLGGIRENPAKAAAAANLVTGTAQSVCDFITLQNPSVTPAFQGPVAGLAIIGSGADFWQEMRGDDTFGKFVKGASVAANAAEFLAFTGIIPDGGTTLKSVCIVVRAADFAYDKYRTIKK